MRRIIFFLPFSVLILLILANSSKALPCCANPLAIIPLCMESERIITEETCCANDYYFGKIDGMPKDRQDCLANFFSSSGCAQLPDKCAIGCCLGEMENSCQDNTAYIDCNGKFSAVFNGQCMQNGTYAIDGCQKGCCCNGGDSKIMLKEACRQPDTFYASTIEEPECERVCAKEAAQPIQAITIPALNKTKACTDIADKNECTGSNCYWCPDTGCMYDCTSCKYQYDSFPRVPDRVCDDLCLGMVCSSSEYCKAGTCFKLPTAKTGFSTAAFFITFLVIFIIITIATALIISSKLRSEK